MKRGSSGLSLVVALDKPSGISSHDAVNACRRIFGERRVGHMGTLDPLATGILPVCVGPATRLNQFLSEKEKSYCARVVFGCATDTDDVCGNPIKRLPVSPLLFDPAFAQDCLSTFLGKSMQVPPQYSAIKVQGKKAYEVARAHEQIELEARPVEIYQLDLLSVDQVESPFSEDPLPAWTLAARVSKGTYIRSLARDLGLAVSSCAHLDALRRTTLGALTLSDCVTLEQLEELGARAALDPLDLLACRFCFADAAEAVRMRNGASLDLSSLHLYRKAHLDASLRACLCTSGIHESSEPLLDGELIAVLFENEIISLQVYNKKQDCCKVKCVFSRGVSRGVSA